jgi:hypothetical protein
MTKQLFNVQIEFNKNFKKVLFSLSIFLFVACASPYAVRQINKTQADAESGDPNAQYLMGTYYFNGEMYLGKQVWPQNKEKAKEFFDKAISSGNKDAQKSVNRFLAVEMLSTQLAISKPMAQSFYDAYGVTNLNEYESAVAEIKSLGYPVKNGASITPNEVIFYLEFKKNANQKNIALPKAVQDLKKDQDAKVAQQLAKEAKLKNEQEIKFAKEAERKKNLPYPDIKIIEKCAGNLYGYTKISSPIGETRQILVEEANNFLDLLGGLEKRRPAAVKAVNIGEQISVTYFSLASQNRGAEVGILVRQIKNIINSECAEYGANYGIKTYLLPN